MALIGAVHAGESGPELIVPALGYMAAHYPKELRDKSIIALPSVNIDRREDLVRGVPWHLRTNAVNVDLSRSFPGEWQKVQYDYPFLPAHSLPGPMRSTESCV